MLHLAEPKPLAACRIALTGAFAQGSKQTLRTFMSVANGLLQTCAAVKEADGGLQADASAADISTAEKDIASRLLRDADEAALLSLDLKGTAWLKAVHRELGLDDGGAAAAAARAAGKAPSTAATAEAGSDGAAPRHLERSQCCLPRKNQPSKSSWRTTGRQPT